MAKNYSFWIGLWKSLKNTAVVIGVPALVFFLDSWTQVLPSKYNVFTFPFVGFLAYLVKNYIQNR